MKKNVILISIILLIILNLSIIGFLIYQNHFINTKLNELDDKVEKSIASNNQQDLQISQMFENQTKSEQQQLSLNNTEKYKIENTPTEGLTPISEDEALETFINYVKEEFSESLEDYDLKSIEKTKVKPTNHFTTKTVKEWIADFEREAYKIYYVQQGNLGDLTGYVDLYTGKVIDGGFRGD